MLLESYGNIQIGKERGVKMGIIEKAGETALDLAKNEAVLDKTSNIMSMLFPYAGLTKKALDMYILDIEKSDMPNESKLIAVLNAKNTIKKLKNQKNIVDIAINTAKDETDFTEKSGVNKEWLERFMESAGFVSDEMVQVMWGKILGKEFEKPGSTPFNMIRILSEITPTYAQAFRKICSMQMIIVGLNENGTIKFARQDVVVPYDKNEKKFNDLGLTFAVFSELETLGLIKLSTSGGYMSGGIPEKKVLLYIDGKTLELEGHIDNEMVYGNVMLTVAGKCLKNITPKEIIEGYYELVKEYMENSRVKFKECSEYQVIKDGSKIYCKKSE